MDFIRRDEVQIRKFTIWFGLWYFKLLELVDIYMVPLCAQSIFKIQRPKVYH
jgi:hypothetical protein